MRVILVPVADRPECVYALRTSFSLARHLGSDVVGCHVRAHRNEAVELGDRRRWLSRSLQQTEWPLIDESVSETQTQSALALFERIAAEYEYPRSKKPGTRETPHALWKEKVGTPPYVIPIIGPASDMVVVSRPRADGGEKARILLMQALMGSHRPVLVLPQEEHQIRAKRIAIGWNRGSHEARTLHAVMPILKQAEEVVFMTIGKSNKLGPRAADMI
ncbi:MAG: hypothetical protein AAGF15_11250, partial [Pseudomonadota bacterium]